MLNDASTFDQEHERRSAAVHDRHLGTVDIDHRVIDAATSESGHQVFDGTYANAILVANGGAHSGINDVFPASRDFGTAAVDICAHKYNTTVSVTRIKCHRHLLTRMQSNAATINRASQRALKNDIFGVHFFVVFQVSYNPISMLLIR